MELTAVQQDALIELLNIGFGRAAAALSELTGHRVVLEVPEVSIHPIAALAPALRSVTADDVATVHQIFSGPVAGDALLILDYEAASMLKQLLTDEPALPSRSMRRRAKSSPRSATSCSTRALGRSATSCMCRSRSPFPTSASRASAPFSKPCGSTARA